MLTYTAPSGEIVTKGFYSKISEEFTHVAGEKVSLTATMGSTTITGAATTTPNQSVTNLANSGTTLPFDVTWDVSTDDTFHAEYTWVKLTNVLDPTKSYQVLVPIATESVTITSNHIETGSYMATAFCVNKMTITGGRSGSEVLVGSTATAATTSTFQVTAPTAP